VEYLAHWRISASGSIHSGKTEEGRKEGFADQAEAVWEESATGLTSDI